MDKIGASHNELVPLCDKKIIICIDVLAASLLVFALIGLTAAPAGFFKPIVQLGTTTHTSLLGIASCILVSNFICSLLVLKRTEPLAHEDAAVIGKGAPPRVSSSQSPLMQLSFLNDKRLNGQLSGIYTLSNEVGIDKTIQEIERLNLEPSSQKRKCHLGVGALHNFDLMASRRSDFGILLDFNPKNREFINKSLELLIISNSPAEFVDKLIAYMELQPDQYNHYKGYDTPINRMRSELTRPSSWLYAADRSGKFQYIKELATQGNIIAITQDFCRVEVFRRLVEILDGSNCCIDTVYLSNLYAFVSLEKFYKAFDFLAQFDPIVIHCSPGCRCERACRCAKEQHIGRRWEKVSKEQGALKLRLN